MVSLIFKWYESLLIVVQIPVLWMTHCLIQKTVSHLLYMAFILQINSDWIPRPVNLLVHLLWFIILSIPTDPPFLQDLNT